MADYPALPLYTDAYLGDTMHLSLEQHGAYLKLLMIAWRSPDCALPDDDHKLARMLGITAKKWASIRAEVAPFFTISGGAWKQKRLTETRRAVAKKSEDNRKAAEARWGAKPLENNNPADASAYAETNANAVLTKTISIYDDDVVARTRAREADFEPPPDTSDILALTAEVCRAAGVRHVDPGHIARHGALVREWLAAGADAGVILDAIRDDRAAPDAPVVSSLKFFDAVVRREIARKEALSHDTASGDGPVGGTGRRMGGASRRGEVVSMRDVIARVEARFAAEEGDRAEA